MTIGAGRGLYVNGHGYAVRFIWRDEIELRNIACGEAHKDAQRKLASLLVKEMERAGTSCGRCKGVFAAYGTVTTHWAACIPDGEQAYNFILEQQNANSRYHIVETKFTNQDGQPHAECSVTYYVGLGGALEFTCEACCTTFLNSV